MATSQQTMLTSWRTIPARRASLSGHASTKQRHLQLQTGPGEPFYITWPAPRSYYSPPSSSPASKDVEPFPDFQNPANTLIIARTLLLDTLYCRISLVGERLGLRPLPDKPFEALHSRIAPYTGHIKEHQDLNRRRVSKTKVLQIGEKERLRRREGNKGKLVRMRGRFTNSCSSETGPEPKSILKAMLKIRAQRGIAQALKYERDFARNLVKCDEEGRTRAVKDVAEYDANLKIIQALRMLRQTYPNRYMQENPTSQIGDVKEASMGKKLFEKVNSKGSSDLAIVRFNCHQPADSSSPRSQNSSDLRIFQSNSDGSSLLSVSSEKEGVPSILRCGAIKLRPGHPSQGLGIRSCLTSMEVAPVHVLANDPTIPATNASKRHVSEHPVNVDSFHAVELDEKEIETTETAMRARAGPKVLEENASKREGHCFSIEKEYEFELLVEPSVGLPNEKATAEATNSRPSSIAPPKVTAPLRIVTLTKPVTKPRLVSIFRRKEQAEHKAAKLQMAPSSRAHRPSLAQPSDFTNDEIEADYVVVNKDEAAASPTELSIPAHKHAFRGYVTRPHPGDRPQSRISLNQQQSEAWNRTSKV